uniref:Uncharacterized protein n=1 Tax=Periophthalmus magnuspinnatus TaxID=409849 RepID=A0A3B3Z6G0_9GOBI
MSPLLQSAPAQSSAQSNRPLPRPLPRPQPEEMVDNTLAQVGHNLSQAMKILDSRYSRTFCVEFECTKCVRVLPCTFHIRASLHFHIQVSHRLFRNRGQQVGEQAHMALLGHSLAAYISVLPRDRLRSISTRVLSDSTLWLCRLFRYDNACAYFHEDDRDGLVRVCRLVLHARYEEYPSEGYGALVSKQPVIYMSASCRPGLGQHLCSQLGLPLSSLCTVPCNTMFGSQHQMDVALLDKLVREDVDSRKLPLLLIANAGTGRSVRHTILKTHTLHAHTQRTLHRQFVCLVSRVCPQAASRSDSLTLTPGLWLGLPAVCAVTLYRHEDPALSLSAGLMSSRPLEKLRALPLWLSLQYLGHSGIVKRIQQTTALRLNAGRRRSLLSSHGS